MQTLEQTQRKLAKTQALAQDARGDPTTRATAQRQAEALMRLHGLHADGSPVQAPPIDWTTRSSCEAAAAGLLQSVLTKDGWYTPARV